MRSRAEGTDSDVAEQFSISATHGIDAEGTMDGQSLSRQAGVITA